VSIDLQTFFSRRFDLPKADTAERAIKHFSLTQKLFFFLCVSVLIVSGLGLLQQVNTHYLVEVPDRGGELTEGIVGSPRFVNPLLAISDADKDLVSLVYSGLLKATPEGALVPDLAESYTVSNDGLIYAFILKNEIKFHDGTPVTTDDIQFTIEKVMDTTLKSPRRANWDGVFIEKVSNREIRFVLKKPYAPFLENTTLGILPKHIWKNANADEFAFSQFNTNPIGSGPYEVEAVSRNDAGIPNIFTLKSFSKYVSGRPNIEKFVIHFYTNEQDLLDAYEAGDIESMGGITARAAANLVGSDAQIQAVILPRIFGVFFNQNQAPVFTNKEVREALNISLDKQYIVGQVLSGYGSPLSTPLPIKGTVTEVTAPKVANEDLITQGKKILETAGWTINKASGFYEKISKKGTTPLSFSISTGDALELKSAANIIAENWRRLGANVTVEVYETGDLNQNIIRPRKYDSLFFGEVIGRDLDFYPFWHSSQRNDPGLNIALYVNSKVDTLLEEARATSDTSLRDKKYSEFITMINTDVPVVFVYSPAYIYVVPKRLQNLEIETLAQPSERFLNIQKWYIETNKIWKIFN